MEGLYIVEEKARTFCPKCKNELVYEQLYNLDLIMYCESCSYKGVVIDCYKDENDLDKDSLCYEE